MENSEYVKACLEYRGGVQERFQKIFLDFKKSKRKIRVAHHVTWTHQFYPGLVKAFLDNSDFFEYDIIHEISVDGEAESLESLGLNVYHINSAARPSIENYDILFLQHPYVNISGVSVDFFGIMRDVNRLLLPVDSSRHPLLCFIPYAFTVIDERHHGSVDGFHNLPIHNIAWKVFCESEWHLDRAQRGAALGADNWVASGYPKLDDIIPSNLPVLNYENPTIIWAPHHNVHFQGIPMYVMHKFLVEMLGNINGLKVIFRPHPNLIKNSSITYENNGVTQSQFEEILEFWSGHVRGSFDFTSNLSLLFEKSDLMITDCGGFQAEYLCSGKPIVSYIQPSLLNNFAFDALSDHGYLCSTVDDIKAVVLRILLDRQDKKNVSRLDFLKGIIPSGGAGNAIVKYIRNSFES